MKDVTVGFRGPPAELRVYPFVEGASFAAWDVPAGAAVCCVGFEGCAEGAAEAEGTAGAAGRAGAEAGRANSSFSIPAGSPSFPEITFLSLSLNS